MDYIGCFFFKYFLQIAVVNLVKCHSFHARAFFHLINQPL